jgi:acetyl-CoA carboxylase alpha subunit
LKNTTEKEQRIIDLEQELKEVREAVAAEKNRLEDELTEEKRKAVEAIAQFNTVSIGRSSFRVEGLSFVGMLTVVSCRVPQL